MTDDEIIAEVADTLRRSKAAGLNDAQLQANVDTYRSSPHGTANWRWRQDCLAEQQRRGT